MKSSEVGKWDDNESGWIDSIMYQATNKQNFRMDQGYCFFPHTNGEDADNTKSNNLRGHLFCPCFYCSLNC